MRVTSAMNGRRFARLRLGVDTELLVVNVTSPAAPQLTAYSGAPPVSDSKRLTVTGGCAWVPTGAAPSYTRRTSRRRHHRRGCSP